MDQGFSGNERLFLNNLEHLLQNCPARCPYGFPHQAIYKMARFNVIPEEIMGVLLAAGYRRYGNTIYIMGCEKCRKCVSIKLNPLEFSPNRSQKRSVKRNSDLSIETNTLTQNKEKTILLQSFFDTRYPGKNNNAESYYTGFFLNGAPFSKEILYYSEEKLLGVSVVDIGKTWLNAVYFFFDPDASKRSLGIFNVINLVNTCKEQNIQNLYLGYWIKECGAMNYKAAFLPHYIQIDGRWVKVN